MNSLMFRYDNDSEYSAEDDDSEFAESKSSDSGELMCRNIDPVLARLMGIIIEEQKQEITWKPPEKPGLDNSEGISYSYCLKNYMGMAEIDFFKKIKHDIRNYQKLSDRQLDYIKDLNNHDKFELIEIYNEILQQREHAQHK
jgi:hypothetical protein